VFAGVTTNVVEQLEGLRPRGRSRLLNWRYDRVTAVEQILPWPESHPGGRPRALRHGNLRVAGCDPVTDPLVRQIRQLGITREAADVLTTVHLEDLARERLAHQ
jgi:hypothetical protein